jgi:hypothetical protein
VSLLTYEFSTFPIFLTILRYDCKVSVVKVRNFVVIRKSFARALVLRVSKIFEADSSTRWVLYLVVHLDLRLLKDSTFLVDDLILMINDAMFGTDEVIIICCGLECLNWVWLLVFLST